MKNIKCFKELYLVVMEKEGCHIDLCKNITGNIHEITKEINDHYSDALKVFICDDFEQAEKVVGLVMLGVEIARRLSA